MPQAPKQLNPLKDLANTNLTPVVDQQTTPGVLIGVATPGPSLMTVNVGGGAYAPPDKYAVAGNPNLCLQATTGVGQGAPHLALVPTAPQPVAPQMVLQAAAPPQPVVQQTILQMPSPNISVTMQKESSPQPNLPSASPIAPPAYTTEVTN